MATTKVKVNNVTDNKIIAYFDPEKPTKNTVKFAEIKTDEFAPFHIGTTYVQKASLGSMGYKSDDTRVLRVTLELVDRSEIGK